MTRVLSAPPAEAASESTPSTALARLVVSALSLVGLVLGLLAGLAGVDAVQTLGLLLFCALGLGSTPWQLDARLDLSARLARAGATGLVLWVLPSVAMVATGQWHPAVLFAVFVLLSVPVHLLVVRRALAEGAGARVVQWASSVRPTGWRPGPAEVLAGVGALLCLVAVLTHRHLTAGLGGYPTQIGAAWIVGLVLVLVSFVAARRRPEWVMAASALLLLLVLTLTPALVYDGPRSQSALKHVDLVEQIRATGSIHASVTIYDAYDGFFAGMAWLADVTGIQDSLRLAVFWPPLLGLLRLVALRVLAGQLLTGTYQRWVAVVLAVLADSIGADYFSPQSVGFVLGLVAFGLALTPGRAPARHLLLLALGCTLAVTHQLSPFVVAGVVGVLTVFRQVRPWWTTALLLVPALAWAGLHWETISGFLYTDALGSVSNFRPPETTEAAGLERLPIVTLSVVGLLVGILLLGGLAFVTLVLHRRDLRSWALACSPAVGLVLVAANPYGQEGIFRAALFGIPWLAVLAARRFSDGPSVRSRLSLLVVSLVLTAGFLLSSSGLDALTVTRVSDVAAVRTMAESSGDDYVLVGLGTGDLPGTLRPGARFVGAETADLGSPAARALTPDARVAWLSARLYSDYLLPNDLTGTDVYALWSDVQSDYQQAYGLQEPADFAALRDALDRSPFWDVVTSQGGTVLFRFSVAAYVADAG
jgi:hypothetical protein